VKYLVVMVSACSFTRGTPAKSDASANMEHDSGAGDALIDAPEESKCFGVSPFALCLPQVPGQMLAFVDGQTISTSGSPKCAGGQGDIVTLGTSTEICAISGTMVSFDGIVSVAGSRPLVVVATQSITVNGTVDASSGPSGSGPGVASALVCGATASIDGTGGGGGAGGSFGGKGGIGGAGNGGTGGISVNAVAQPVGVLRGGCAGGTGPANGGAVGGLGGGAIFLVSRDTITIASTAVVKASGAGGSGGLPPSGGAGGGGSGGMIVLAASTLTVNASAKMFANGGGGGGGANPGNPGGPGSTATVPDVAAGGGGAGGGNASSGGNGGFKTTSASTAASASTGAGGGGGGVGVIRVLTGQTIAANLSPSPS
jgi:hypothetical protein